MLIVVFEDDNKEFVATDVQNILFRVKKVWKVGDSSNNKYGIYATIINTSHEYCLNRTYNTEAGARKELMRILSEIEGELFRDSHYVTI